VLLPVELETVALKFNLNPSEVSKLKKFLF